MKSDVCNQCKCKDKCHVDVAYDSQYCKAQKEITKDDKKQD